MIKLPDSVPPMVTQSLAPVFVVTIIFVLVFIIRVLFGLTASGSIFQFFIDVVNAPLNSLVASPLSIIIIMEVLAVLWFFGIHNAVLQGPSWGNQYDNGRFKYCGISTRTRTSLISFHQLSTWACMRLGSWALSHSS